MSNDFTNYVKQMGNFAERDSYFKSKATKGRLTGYALQNRRGEKIPITLEKGVSLISAPSGNGKTSFLINFASESVKKDILEKKKRTNIFLTYEEPEEMIITSFFCRYAHKHANFNPRLHSSFYDAVKSFLADKKSEHFADMNQAKIISALSDAFFNDYIFSKRLIIKKCGFRVEELLDFLNWASSNYDLSVTFFDYIQLMRRENPTEKSYDNMQYIIGCLREKAVEKDLILMSAAQLRREASDLTKITAAQMADCIDLVKDSVQILGCVLNPAPQWGTKKGEDSPYLDVYERLIPKEDIKAMNALKRGMLPKMDGYIYLKTLKNRYGENNTDMLFKWQGEAKYIEPNSKLVEDASNGADLDDDL